ncbi:MAG: hypothetical protein ABIJ46_03900 [bacterium]
MRIGIIGSMHFTERMIETRDRLIELGHDAYLTGLADPFVGKDDEEKERIKIEQKNNQDAIREFWRLMQGGDAVLVMNLDKHGIGNYIGGNTFLEMGFAHVLDQRIFLLNPIPDMPHYRTEIEAFRPVVIDGDLERVGRE